MIWFDSFRVCSRCLCLCVYIQSKSKKSKARSRSALPARAHGNDSRTHSSVLVGAFFRRHTARPQPQFNLDVLNVTHVLNMTSDRGGVSLCGPFCWWTASLLVRTLVKTAFWLYRRTTIDISNTQYFFHQSNCHHHGNNFAYMTCRRCVRQQSLPLEVACTWATPLRG